MIGIVVFTPSKLTQTFKEQQIALAAATGRLVALVVERERLLREREEANTRALALHEANRQLDTFLGLASHELRTPLASMKLSLQLIRRNIEQEYANKPLQEARHPLTSLQALLETADRQMERLERLVKDLLNAERIQEGNLELRLEQTDLLALVQEVVAEQRKLTPERLIHLHLPPDQPLLTRADGDLIRQAVTNYLTNALKYAPETAPVLVGVDRQADEACVWVRDQGPGIPAAEQEHLWERFHQVPGIRERNGSSGGLGLGLYVTKMVIERHKGHVGMNSTPGQGTIFWFTLSLA